ncbi:MAG: ATP-binding protein [Actinomycetota bacterium]|nr:ATP-binding protein [Actinomycetota bacterium]
MREDPGFSSHAAAELSPHIRSFIGVPVVLSDGAFYGTLCAVDPEPQKTLARQQADLMAVLARLLATQIERQRAEDALAQTLRARTEFLAEVSHQLRTPLTVIHGSAEVGLHLERGCAHEELLREIVKESGSMSRMVEDLLLLARSDSDSLPMIMETVSVAWLLEGLAKRAQALAREQHASLQIALSGEGRLRCDAERIEQAVLVLIDNAARYGPSGGPITLSSSTRTGELLIEVTDQGPGIPPEELPRTFERFYRCENASEKRGSGLGLPIAKTIAESHGGRLEAESEVGEGTRMSLRLSLTDGF